MHELGVLCAAVKKVNEVALQNKIERVKFLTLEVGESSSFVPVFFHKLFPAAKENFPILKDTTLKIVTVAGDGLIIKEIGY